MVSDLKEKLIELEPILKQKAIDNEKL